MDRENAHQQPAVRERTGRRAWVRSAALVGSGLIAGGIVAGTVPAKAADEGTATPESSTSQDAEGREASPGRGHHGGDPSQPQRHHEEPLPGHMGTQVSEAALAGSPDAEIERAGTGSGGGYEAHIVPADDERFTVVVDEDLRITGTEEHGD